MYGIKLIKQTLALLGRRWLAVVIVYAIGLALLPVVLARIPTYKGVVQLLIVSDQAAKDTTSVDPNLPGIISSSDVLGRVISRLRLETDSITLAKKIKMKPAVKASIIEVTYKDTDARRAADVANAIGDESAKYYHELATRGYSDVITALDAQIAKCRSKIAAADKRLQSASADNAFASSDKALDILTTQIDQIDAERGQMKATLAADNATVAASKKQLSDISTIVRAEVLQKDPVYGQLQGSVAKDVADLSSERSSFTELFPGLLALSRRIEREQPMLASAARSAMANNVGLSTSYTQIALQRENAIGSAAADSERLKSTNLQLREEQNHLRQVAGAGALVGTLRAERDAVLQEYLTLHQRLGSAEADAAQAASLGTLVVVSHAVPGPSTLWLWMLVLLIIVLLLALGAAYVNEALDRRFWGPREMEHAYGRAVLVEVGRQG